MQHNDILHAFLPLTVTKICAPCMVHITSDVGTSYMYTTIIYSKSKIDAIHTYSSLISTAVIQ